MMTRAAREISRTKPHCASFWRTDGWCWRGKGGVVGCECVYVFVGRGEGGFHVITTLNCLPPLTSGAGQCNPSLSPPSLCCI